MPLTEQPEDSLCTLWSVVLSPGLQLDAALGLTDELHELHLGCAFLSQCTTIWDSQVGKMYICAPR